MTKIKFKLSAILNKRNDSNAEEDRLMWKKTDAEEPQFQPQPQSQPPAPAPIQPTPSRALRERAMIGSTIFIKGDLTGEEDLLIEGQIEGKIELRQHNITVGKNGRVKADVYGKVISIEGDVQGNLYGEDQLILRQSSTVRGNITAPRVILEDGSNFKGSIDMTPKETRDVAPAIKPVPEIRAVAAEVKTDSALGNAGARLERKNSAQNA